MMQTEFDQSVQADIVRMMQPQSATTFYAFECFFKGKRTTVVAETTYQAQQSAAVYFKAKKAYEITVMRADITHSTTI